MRMVKANDEIMSNIISLSGKKIIDIGCGTGELVRWMSSQGANVVGLDTEIMIKKTSAFPKTSDEKYIVITGNILPFEDNYADAIIYFASLHHIQMDSILASLKESSRVLNNYGVMIIVEPVLEDGSYYEITRLVGDEREIQAHALTAIKNCFQFGFKETNEDYFYFERSFDDYLYLLNIHVDDARKREKYIKQARAITKKLALKSSQAFQDFRYKSICRLNVLQRTE